MNLDVKSQVKNMNDKFADSMATENYHKLVASVPKSGLNVSEISISITTKCTIVCWWRQSNIPRS
jgi:hypothetical protein